MEMTKSPRREEILMRDLASRLKPVPMIKRPYFLFGLLGVLTFLYYLFMLWDQSGGSFHEAFGSEHFALLMLLLPLGLALSATFAAYRLSVPGRRWSLSGAIVPGLIFFGWLLAMILRHRFQVDVPAFHLRPPVFRDFICTREIWWMSLLPMAALVVAQRYLASPHPAASGLILGLSAVSWAALCMELLCDDASPVHQLYGHGLAVILFAGIGALAGRLALRW